ncbi:MAG: aldo/keto reductase [Arenicella sp.]|nr:aldo/keto reductase [Arenicella sp.]
MKVNKVLAASQGPKLSEIVQGYWRMGDWGMSPQQHLSFLKSHVELGITTVDHANVYGAGPSCEELFGNVLKLDPSVRDHIEIVSKCGIELVADDGKHVNHYDSGTAAIEKSVTTSLSRMAIESLDVLLIHRPDWLMDVDAIAESFTRLRTSGKVQHFGVSNFTAAQFALLQSRLDAPLVTNQIEINPLNQAAITDGTLDQLQQLRVRPMAWSCLAGGRVFTEKSEQMSRLNATLSEIAGEIGAASIDQVLYAWSMALPSNPMVIVGSGNSARVKAAVDALKLRLSREQWYRIWVAATGHGVP